MSTVGGTLDTMTNLSTTFKRNADQALQIRSAIDTAMNGTDWKGPAADRFRDFWAQFGPKLADLNQALTEAGSEVDQRREALDAATR